PASFTLFPYTTLFRSRTGARISGSARICRRETRRPTGTSRATSRRSKKVGSPPSKKGPSPPQGALRRPATSVTDLPSCPRSAPGGAASSRSWWCSPCWGARRERTSRGRCRRLSRTRSLARGTEPHDGLPEDLDENQAPLDSPASWVGQGLLASSVDGPSTVVGRREGGRRPSARRLRSPVVFVRRVVSGWGAP